MVNWMVRAFNVWQNYLYTYTGESEKQGKVQDRYGGRSSKEGGGGVPAAFK